MRLPRVAVVVVGLGALAGCVSAVETPRPEPRAAESASAPPPTSTAPSTTPLSAADTEQAETLKAIAKSYATRFKKVTPSLNVAPTLCAAPAPPIAMHMSRSEDTATHGKKVYYLYAANDDAYVKDGGHKGTTQPADQILVKESWAAVPADDGEMVAGKRGEVVNADGKRYRAGERGSLFIMARHGDGWRFGLVAPDGTATVEGAATKSCHGCHDAQPDGLFGLKP